METKVIGLDEGVAKETLSIMQAAERIAELERQNKALNVSMLQQANDLQAKFCSRIMDLKAERDDLQIKLERLEAEIAELRTVHIDHEFKSKFWGNLSEKYHSMDLRLERMGVGKRIRDHFLKIYDAMLRENQILTKENFRLKSKAGAEAFAARLKGER